MASVELSYYYGYEAEQFSFYRIPKLLFTDNRFAGISTDAKLLYGILLDRMSLSMKNGWHDDQGRVYIIFTLDDVTETLGYKAEKAIKLFNELDTKKGVGLIERVRQGQGRASLIYVKNFAGEKQTSEKPKSRPRKNRGQDFGKTEGNKTEYSDTDWSKKRLLTDKRIMAAPLFFGGQADNRNGGVINAHNRTGQSKRRRRQDHHGGKSGHWSFPAR